MSKFKVGDLVKRDMSPRGNTGPWIRRCKNEGQDPTQVFVVISNYEEGFRVKTLSGFRIDASWHAKYFVQAVQAKPLEDWM